MYPRDFSASALFVNLNVCNFAILRRKLVYSFLNVFGYLQIAWYVRFLNLCILANVS